MMHTPDQELEAIAALFRSRNAVYRDHYRQHGAAMVAIFPDGVFLRTPADHVRFFLLTMRLTKLMRYGLAWYERHVDSARDEAAYAAMAASYDQGVPADGADDPWAAMAARAATQDEGAVR